MPGSVRGPWPLSVRSKRLRGLGCIPPSHWRFKTHGFDQWSWPGCLQLMTDLQCSITVLYSKLHMPVLQWTGLAWNRRLSDPGSPTCRTPKTPKTPKTPLVRGELIGCQAEHCRLMLGTCTHNRCTCSKTKCYLLETWLPDVKTKHRISQASACQRVLAAVDIVGLFRWRTVKWENVMRWCKKCWEFYFQTLSAGL